MIRTLLFLFLLLMPLTSQGNPLWRPVQPQPVQPRAFSGIVQPGLNRAALPRPTVSQPQPPVLSLVPPRSPMTQTVYIPGGQGGMGRRVVTPMASMGPADPLPPRAPTRAELSPQGRAMEALREDVNWVYGAEGHAMMLRAMANPQTLQLLNVAGQTGERVTPGQLISLGILPQPRVDPITRSFQPNPHEVRAELAAPPLGPDTLRALSEVTGREYTTVGVCRSGAYCPNVREYHYDTAGASRDVPRVQGLAVRCVSGACPRISPGGGPHTEVRVHVHDPNNTTVSMSMFSPSSTTDGRAIIAGTGNVPEPSRFLAQGAASEVLRLAGNPPGTPEALAGVRRSLSPRGPTTQGLNGTEVPDVFDVVLPRVEPAR